VIHCPAGDIYPAVGVAPLRRMIEQGISVALGTDGPVSPHSPDLLESMKVAALLAKTEMGEAAALPPADLLRMATVNGARLLGRRDLGQITPGAKADLTLINLNTSRAIPAHYPDNAVVYNTVGPDVHTVIVDGQVLLEAGRVTALDETALLAECRLAVKRLLKRASVSLGRDQEQYLQQNRSGG
jgi:5-methylthioadenosine/S-adenosylhomocysteine deaminase